MDKRLIDAIAYCKELIKEKDYPGRSKEFMDAIEVAIADLSDMPTIDALTLKAEEKTMYDRIKNMSMDEMKCFVYWVYLMGNEDGRHQCCDSESGYFAGHMISLDREEVMPTDSISDLWEKLDESRETYNQSKNK